MNRKWIVLLVILSTLIPALLRAEEEAVPQPQGAYEGDVTAILNGDTFEIDGTTFHLLGVDAPEPNLCPRNVSCRAAEARAFLEEKISGRTITYDYDRTHGRRDKRGVRRVYLYLDGELINAAMIEKGNAFADRSRLYSMKEAFVSIEDLARRRNMGLWHSCPVECTSKRVCRTKSW